VEDVVLHVVDAPRDHDAADLGLLPEGEDVGLDTEVFVGPQLAGDPHAGLHLVENEQEFILVRELTQLVEELLAEVIVPAFALDRLDDEARDVVPVFLHSGLDLPHRFLLGPLHIPDYLIRDRERQLRVDDARP
jgi:hypothetical protein